MNNHTKSKNFLQAAMVCGITILFVVPLSMLGSATDTTPPTIYWINFMPSYQMQGYLDFILEFWVTDGPSGSGVQEARIILSGPVGFPTINETVDGYAGDYVYEYTNDNPLLGTYSFYIRAVDNAGNVALSPVYHFLILSPLPTVYVDANNINGPWDGTQAHPFDNIAVAMFTVTSSGTIRIASGVYHESTTVTKPVNIAGQNRNAVIIDGTEVAHNPFMFNSDPVVMSNITMRNWSSSLILNRTISVIDCQFYNFTHDALGFSGTNSVLISRCAIHNNINGILINSGYGVIKNKVLTYCDIYNNTVGVYINGGPSLNNNTFHHNNFYDNGANFHVASSTLGSNAWDDGSIGNYWSDYRQRYPNAHIIPSTGTWDTPYVIFTTNNRDHHPWVYPNGYIDTVPPVVTVTSPNGGETLSGQTTITWTASDDLTSNLNGRIGISYSADAGATWQSIAQHLNNTGSYVWDTNSVPDGTHYLIKVNASDEFQNVGSDVSNGVFTILNHPNQAPNTPRQPTGPTSGYVGTEYTYTSNTTDPNNDQVYYKWSWGTEESDWMGPYASGATVSAVHTWAKTGTYDVKVKAKDTSDAESIWSKALTVTIAEVQQQPNLTVENFKGGFGLSAVVTNTGDAVATNVTWSINLDGKLIFRARNTTGTIPSIAPGDSVIIKTGVILGFGKTNIEATATCEEGATYTEDGSAFILLFLVVGVTEPLP